MSTQQRLTSKKDKIILRKIDFQILILKHFSQNDGGTLSKVLPVLILFIYSKNCACFITNVIKILYFFDDGAIHLPETIFQS